MTFPKATASCETPSDSSTTGYSNNAWPASNMTVLTLDFSDSYSNNPSKPSAYSAPAGVNTQLIGLKVGGETAVLTHRPIRFGMWNITMIGPG